MATPEKEIRRRSGGKSRIGETTGDCAAVCCCCPCAVVHLFILAMYRLPASIWRRRMRWRRKKNISPEENEDRRQTSTEEESRGGDEIGGGNDVVGWDNEMWRRFYGGGFWRRDYE